MIIHISNQNPSYICLGSVSGLENLSRSCCCCCSHAGPCPVEELLWSTGVLSGWFVVWIEAVSVVTASVCYQPGIKQFELFVESGLNHISTETPLEVHVAYVLCAIHQIYYPLTDWKTVSDINWAPPYQSGAYHPVFVVLCEHYRRWRWLTVSPCEH